MFGSAGKTFTITFLGKNKATPAINAITAAIAGWTAATTATAAEAVKVSAEYEKTRKSLEVFTGSTRRANAELAEVSNLARNTQGLRLADAEEGTVRLRALGFAAKTARDLVAGIAKNKVLSGSDESAVNRVIQNLEQLKAGSPQVKKDIQQMVLAIPTLSKVINETFGSLEKFQTALKKNPGAALEKFAEAAKNTQVGNAGLADAFIKLQDEFLRAQRLFGEPLLEPLTESIQNLSKFLEENKDTWRSWGNYVADIIAGINAPDPESLIPKLLNAPDSKYGLIGYKNEKDLMNAYNSGAINTLSYTTRYFGMGIRDIDQWTRNFGDPDSISSYLNEKQKIGQNRRMLSEGSKRLRADGTIDFSEFSGGRTQKEIEADNKAIADKATEDRERTWQQELASIKRNADSTSAILKNRYDTEQALLDRNIRYTDEQESAYIQRSAQIKQNFYSAERSRIENYYGKVISLSEAGSDEALKAEADKQKELANLNSQEVQEAYKSQRAVLELEQKIQNERRQNLIRFNQIQTSEIQQSANKQLFELEKNLDKGNVSYQDYFNQQINIANSSLSSLLELNRKNLDLELQDKTLTAEQVVNLRRESALEERRLVHENEEKLYQIQKASIDRQKDLISTYASFRSNIISSASDIQGGFADLLFGNRSTGAQSKIAANTLLDAYNQQFNYLSKEIELNREKAHAEDVRLGILNKNKSLISTRTDDVSAEIQKAQNDLKSLEDNLKNLSQGYDIGAGSRYAIDVTTGKFFDQITKQTVENSNNSEAIATLEKQINEQKTLLSRLTENQKSFSEAITSESAQTENIFWAIVGKLEVDLASLERYKVLLNDAIKTFDGFKATPKGVDDLQRKILEQKQRAELANINIQIESQQKVFDLSEGDLAKEKEALKLSELKQQREALGIRQLAERDELYRKSIPGLRDYIRALSDGDKQATAFARNGAIKSILEDQASLLEQNIYLQEKIKAVGNNAAARYKNAWLEAILAVKEANIQAVESQVQSQVKLADSATLHVEQVRARVLGHLAEQKTLSEAFADGIIGAFDKLTGLMNKSLGKVGDIPIIGDLLKFGNQQVASNLTKNLLDKFFPSEFSELFNKEKNPIAAPIVEQQKLTNKYLSAIAGSTIGVGSANTILPTAPKSMKDILKIFTGIDLGGGSSGNITSGQVYGSGQNPNNPGVFHLNSNGQLPISPNSMWEIYKNTQQPNLPRDYPAPKKGWQNVLFGDKGFGFNGGTVGGIGALASLAGSAIGGRFGNILSMAGTGASIGAMFGPVGGLIGAGAGALFGLFSGDPNKKKDKKENLPALQKAFTDAFTDYRQLISDVRSLRVDPDGALSTGDQLRSQVASGFGIEFLSKKYKKESANLIKQKLNQIDMRPGGMREQLEQAVEMSKAAGERANRLLPEFATGGFLSNGFLSQYGGFKRSYGLLKGGIPGKDSIPVLAQENEMFLTRKHQAEIIRGAGYDVFSAHTDIPNYPKPKMMESGGYIGTGQTATASAPNFTIELSGVIALPDAKAYIRSDEGQREIAITVKKAMGNNQITKSDFKS